MLGSTSPKSAMVWSAANIGALVLIMLWAHFMYTRADQDSVVNPKAGPALKKNRPERPGLRIFQTKTAQSSPTRKNFRPKRPGPVWGNLRLKRPSPAQKNFRQKRPGAVWGNLRLKRPGLRKFQTKTARPGPRTIPQDLQHWTRSKKRLNSGRPCKNAKCLIIAVISA